MSIVSKLRALRGKLTGKRVTPKKLVKYAPDPDSVKENNYIKGQQNQIAELQGIVGRKVADEAAERESEKDYNEEEEVKLDLHHQEIDIRKKELGMFFSWKNFWGMYFGVPGYTPKGLDPKSFSKMFRDNLVFTTFDRKNIVSRFGDYGTTTNGTTTFLDQNNQPVIMGQEMKDLLFEPGSLGNDIQRGIIPICKDSEGGRVENPMIWKASMAIRLEDGNIEYTSAKKESFYKIIQEKEDSISDLYTKLEEKEMTIIEIQDALDDYKISFSANEKSAQIARNQKTKMAAKLSQIEKVFGQTTEDLTKYQQIYQMQEDHIASLENQVAKLTKQAEKVNATTDFYNTLDQIKSILAVVKKNKIVPKKKNDSVGESPEEDQ